MSSLLLLCAPTDDYPRSFHKLLGQREIKTWHVQEGRQCVEAIQNHQPDFVLISSETDSGRLASLIGSLRAMTRLPYIFFSTFKPTWRFSQEEGLLPEQCVQRPFDEARFVQQLETLDIAHRESSEEM